MKRQTKRHVTIDDVILEQILFLYISVMLKKDVKSRNVVLIMEIAVLDRVSEMLGLNVWGVVKEAEL